jgi:hypothetical protein
MDFIERLFHISPDGDSGALELALLLVPVVVVALLLLARHSKRTRLEINNGGVGLPYGFAWRMNKTTRGKQ